MGECLAFHHAVFDDLRKLWTVAANASVRERRRTGTSVQLHTRHQPAQFVFWLALLAVHLHGRPPLAWESHSDEGLLLAILK